MRRIRLQLWYVGRFLRRARHIDITPRQNWREAELREAARRRDNGPARPLFLHPGASRPFTPSDVAPHSRRQHGDLHTLLFEMASKAGVDFRFNSRVKHVDADSGSVILEGGESLSADVIVGADGVRSVVRSVFEPPRERSDNQTLVTSVHITPLQAG